jgi:hypothetical protein
VDAEAGLRRLRQSFRTFPFADAARCWDSSLGAEVVDLTATPGRDESAFLLDLLILLSQKVSAVFETNHVFGEIHFSACEGLG